MTLYKRLRKGWYSLSRKGVEQVKQSQNLYDYLYQMLVSQFLNGAFQAGQRFPSQREICQQYNVGITTVRKVMKMLGTQGYIRTNQGQPSIVTYQAPTENYIAFLVQRQDEIADAYRGLELLMPILYREGAKRCGESELRLFHTLLEGISVQMELDELYKQANAFFIALIQTMNNQLMMDLELDSENYLHIPYIPIAGVANPFANTAKRLSVWMRKVIGQIENKDYDAFCAGIACLYRESAKRVDDYLHALSGQVSAQIQTKGEMHWFRPKGRSELYARLAMTIIRRMVAGEFDGQKYLPSIPKLTAEYGVMKDTASRAVEQLNALGFVQTLDKKGSLITMDGVAAMGSSADLTKPVIQEQLALFMDALQVVALTANDCVASFSAFPEDMAALMEDRLQTADAQQISPLLVQLLMNGLIQMLPGHCLKNIFAQLDELMLWGNYLRSVDQALFPDASDTAAAIEALTTALKNQDMTGVADAYGKIFSSIYHNVCQGIAQIPGCFLGSKAVKE